MISQTRDVVYLDDGDYAVLTPEGYRTFRLEGDEVDRGVHTVTWDLDAIEKGVRKDRDIIYPGEARLLYLWRALLPKLWWKTVMSFEKK